MLKWSSAAGIRVPGLTWTHGRWACVFGRTKPEIMLSQVSAVLVFVLFVWRVAAFVISCLLFGEDDLTVGDA